jgi:hypothetical protein
MATCTFIAANADTAATPNTSAAFVPTAGSLLVVFAQASAAVGETDPTLTNSLGLTMYRADWGFFSTTYLHSVWVGSAGSTASSQTLTFDTAVDPGTGTMISIYEVTGMTKFGSSAVRQVARNNGAGTVTPTAVFPGVCLTGNPTLASLGNVTNPAGMTGAPTGWTQAIDTGYASPAHGIQLVHRNSGFTGTTITWDAGDSPSAWGSQAIELDASSSSVVPVLQNHYRRRSI